MRRIRTIATAGLALAVMLVAAACQAPVWENFGLLEFPGLEAYRGPLGGRLGEVAFGDILVGEGDSYTLSMRNASSKPLTIDRIAFDSPHYDFYNHVSPAFPITLAAGETSDLLTVGFYPTDNGDLDGRVMFEVADRVVSVGLTGRGVWQLTLSIHPDTLDEGFDAGQITSPVTVTPASGAVTFLSADGVVKLTALANIMSKFNAWEVLGTPKVEPDFADDNLKAEDTIVTLNAHTAIQASFYNPYVYFPVAGATPLGATAYDSLQAAIDACVPSPTLEAVIIKRGSHTVGTGVTLPEGVSIFGGYSADYTTRAYKTPAERSTTNPAILTFAAGTGLSVSAASGQQSVIEGVTLTRSAASATPVITVGSGAKPVIRYTTITTQGEGPALQSSYGSPRIGDCVITGGAGAGKSVGAYFYGGAPYLEWNDIRSGNTSGNYSEAYAVRFEDNSYPDLYMNTITAGTASGTKSASYGVYLDFGCRPLIVGNTIDGGRAPGSGGISTGVFYINKDGKATVRYNTISGGFGALQARALYAAQGANYYLRYNNLTADQASGSTVGLYLDTNGRVRRLIGNGFVGLGTLQYTWLSDEAIGDIDELNGGYYLSDTDANKAEAISLPGVPSLGVRE